MTLLLRTAAVTLAVLVFALPASAAHGAVGAQWAGALDNAAVLTGGDIVALERPSGGGLDLRVKPRGSTTLDRVKLAPTAGPGWVVPADASARLVWLEDGVVHAADWDPRGLLRPVAVQDSSGALAAGARLVSRSVGAASAGGSAAISLWEAETHRPLVLTRGRDESRWTLSAPPAGCDVTGGPGFATHTDGRTLGAWACRTADGNRGLVSFAAALFDPVSGWGAVQTLSGQGSESLPTLSAPDVAWRADGAALIAYGTGGAAVLTPGATTLSLLREGTSGGVTKTYGGFDVAGDPVVVASTNKGFRGEPWYTASFTGPLTGELVPSLPRAEREVRAVNGRGDVLLTGGTLWSRRTARGVHHAIGIGVNPAAEEADLDDDGGLLAALPGRHPDRLRVVRVLPGGDTRQSTTLACGPVDVLGAVRRDRRELVVAAIRGRLRTFWRLPDGGWRRVDTGADEPSTHVDAVLAPTGDAVLFVGRYGEWGVTRVVTLADAARAGRRSPRPTCGR